MPVEYGHYRVIVIVEIEMPSHMGPGQATLKGINAVKEVLPNNADVVSGKSVFVKDGSE